MATRLFVFFLALAVPGACLASGPPVTARHHMAATANPLATRAALSVLRDGGSAVDAAIAGQMMLAVVEPQSSGLGGGSLLLVWDAAARKLSYIEGLASAPAGMPEDYAHEQGVAIDRAVLDRTGRVVAVPGTLRTLAMLHARDGRLPWARLFRDAIETAEHGFALPAYLHGVLVERRSAAHRPSLAGYFEPDGTPLPTGTPIRNPALAATLRRVATEGPEAIYAGAVAADIAAGVRQGSYPGTLDAADMAAYRPRERAPVCTEAFQHRICSAAPPASGGVALQQELGLLDRVRIAAAAPGSLEAAHLILEAARLAEADRRVFIGDPDFVDVPVGGLLDPGYLDLRARQIGPRAMTAVLPGDPPRKHASLPASDPGEMPATTHLAVVDDAGNAVSFTTTINLNFGADIVTDGVVLNDALTNFATRPVGERGAGRQRRRAGQAADHHDGAQHRVRPGWLARPHRRRRRRSADHRLGGRDDPGRARLAPERAPRRSSSRASAARTGRRNWSGDTPAAGLADGLRALGHVPKVTAMNAGVQAIAITPGGLEGWADPRRDGVALGD